MDLRAQLDGERAERGGLLERSGGGAADDDVSGRRLDPANDGFEGVGTEFGRVSGDENPNPSVGLQSAGPVEGGRLGGVERADIVRPHPGETPEQARDDDVVRSRAGGVDLSAKEAGDLLRELLLVSRDFRAE